MTEALTAVEQSAPAQDSQLTFDAAARHLSDLLTAENRPSRQQNLAVALRAQALHRLLSMAAVEGVPVEGLVQVLKLCAEAMQLVSTRDSFASMVRSSSPVPVFAF